MRSILYVDQNEEITKEEVIEIKEGVVFTSFIGKKPATLIVNPEARVWEVVRCSAYYHHDGIRDEVNKENILECFFGFFGIPTTKGFCTLYKRVKADFSDYYTGSYKYHPGATVTADDWIANDRITCGYGLHLAPTIELSRMWNEGAGSRLLLCRVAINDISIFPYRIVQVRCRQVFVEKEIEDRL
jgi:hypothetical protein